MPSYANRLSLDSSANMCIDISSNSYIKKTQFVPTFPRKLTQAQLYSVNEIINNRRIANTEPSAPNNSNLFATLFPRSIDEASLVYTNPNISYERNYFGPVTLERLSIKLIDDKGNLVNLHGHNWSFSLEIEQLYQY